MGSAGLQAIVVPVRNQSRNFPEMVHLIRRYQQQMMIVVTILVIISIVAFYNSSRFMDRTGGNNVGVIYGRPVTMAQAQKLVQKFELAKTFGPYLSVRDLLVSLAANATSEQGAKENFIWNSLVLKHEAEVLGVQPTEDEVLTVIQAMPLFQTRGAYDSNLYNDFISGGLNPRMQGGLGRFGLQPKDLEEMVADDLRVKKIKQVLGATTPPSASDVRDVFLRTSQMLDASSIRLKLDDFLAAVQVPDEKLKEAYEQRKGNLKTEEMRKVKYVAFVLPTTDKPLPTAARTEALKVLQKKAEDFSVKMAEKDANFEKLAESDEFKTVTVGDSKVDVKVEETPAFPESKPPEAIGSQDFASKAFTLTKEQPNSDPAVSPRGYYVMQLAEITPPRPLTFEEAKANLLVDLKREQAQETMTLRAKEVHNKIVEAMKAGKSFAEAAQTVGVKPETFPPFSPQDVQRQRFSELPDAVAVMQTAQSLNEGELSGMIPTEAGGVLVHLDKREPIDDAKFNAEKARWTEILTDRYSGILFQEWIKHRRAASQKKEGSA